MICQFLRALSANPLSSFRARSTYWCSRACRSNHCTGGPSPNASTQISNKVLVVNQSALYPALHRLENQGWLKAEWRASENNRRAKFYSLTPTGRKQLSTELASWRRLSSAISLVAET